MSATINEDDLPGVTLHATSQEIHIHKRRFSGWWGSGERIVIYICITILLLCLMITRAVT